MRILVRLFISLLKIKLTSDGKASRTVPENARLRLFQREMLNENVKISRHSAKIILVFFFVQIEQKQLK